MEAIGDRVRQLIASSGRTQAQVAAATGLSEPQLSKSLSGTRQFSAVELAQLADLLNAPFHWLVTGEPDPVEVKIAARHDFDGFAGTYSAHNASEDIQVLKDIALLYRQAYR